MINNICWKPFRRSGRANNCDGYMALRPIVITNCERLIHGYTQVCHPKVAAIGNYFFAVLLISGLTLLTGTTLFKYSSMLV